MKSVMRTIVRVVNYDKRNWVDTLRPKGVESCHNGYRNVIENGHMIPGSKMASKAFIVICDVELGKPYMLPESPGRDLVRVNDGIEGRGIDKKRKASCNEMYRGSKFALTRKSADLSKVFHCMHGCKPVNVSSSITPVIGEKLTDIQPKLQWADIPWKAVEEHVNRLQTGITKAVNEQKWHLVRRKKQLLSTPTMIDRIVQMLHVLTLSWNEISRVASTTLCHGNKTAARYRKGYEMLERYEGKLSRTVLRRGGASSPHP